MDYDLVSYETAKLAKEAGFIWKCSNMYIIEQGVPWVEYIHRTGFSNNMLSYYQYSAPTYAVLQRWLREECLIHVNPVPYLEPYLPTITGYYIGEILNKYGAVLYEGDDNYSSYENALDAGLEAALKYYIESNVKK